MKKYNILLFIAVFMTQMFWAQIQKYPVFENCDSVAIPALESCFNNQVKVQFNKRFVFPEKLKKEGFSARVNIVFTVDDKGVFKALYSNTPYKEIQAEVQRAFATFPKVKPAKYNNHAVDMQFVLPVQLPLSDIQNPTAFEEKLKPVKPMVVASKNVSDTAVKGKDLFPEHGSSLNIPLTHMEYLMYDSYMNASESGHTAIKPYTYNELQPHFDLTAYKQAQLKPKSSWFGRKFFNEHMLQVQGKGYWFNVNPGVDLSVGKSEGTTTFNNTRALLINGGLGKKFTYSVNFFESQGKFAPYVNAYAESIRPAGGNPALIPGRGIAKSIYTDAYDYPVSESLLSYTPNSYFNIQFGYGKNFIGDGYRSLMLSDAASPYTYFKLTTKFWKFKYTNIWMSLQDVRPELTVDGAYKTKYMALHYLSWNATKSLNIGLFEAVLWDNVNERGFDINYLNPLLFYTAFEFSSGSRAGNSLLGMSLKYKRKSVNIYAQFVLDDLRTSEITSGSGWWANKYGLQLGAKYWNAFKIENLMLQAEFNLVRPFTFSHDELNYNYGHNNQSLAHPWGSNFKEFIGIAHYKKDRWYATAKLIVGKKGFDFNNGVDTYSYGGNVFTDNDLRAGDYGHSTGQGNTANVFLGDLQMGYVLNPATNLKIYGNMVYRKFDLIEKTAGFGNSNTTWISIGLRTDLFNWYFDF